MSYCKNFLILLTFGALAFGSVQEPSPDEERITELFVKVIQAWGQRPTSFITSRFADDIYLIDPQRRTLKGVEQIRQAYTDLLHRGLLQGSQLTVDLDDFRFKEADAATVDGAWEVAWPYAQGRIWAGREPFGPHQRVALCAGENPQGPWTLLGRPGRWWQRLEV